MTSYGEVLPSQQSSSQSQPSQPSQPTQPSQPFQPLQQQIRPKKLILPTINQAKMLSQERGGCASPPKIPNKTTLTGCAIFHCRILAHF